MAEIIQRHLPEHCYSSRSRPIEGVVIHYFSNIYADPDRWDDPNRCWELFHDLNLAADERQFGPWQALGPKRSYASADYLIARDGTVYELVPRGLKSWHAGKSIHQGRDNCNNYMTGYEVIAAPQVDAQNYSYTDAQYEAAAELVRRDMQQGGFGIDMVVGHDEIRANWNAQHPDDQAAVKKDPGETWDWDRFRSMLG